MTCILKLAPASGGGEVYLVNPDQSLAARGGPHFSRNPRERAAAEAQEILQKARDEADAICLAALERGYNEGSAQAKAEYSAVKAEAEELIKTFHQRQETFLTDIEPKVVKLSVEIAEKILRAELEMKPEAVLEIVRSALRQVRDEESIKLYVNPQDSEMIAANRQSLKESAEGVRQLDVIEDRRVGKGGCMAESPAGKLDARISTQLSEVARVFTEAASDNPGQSNLGSDEIQQDT